MFFFENRFFSGLYADFQTIGEKTRFDFSYLSAQEADYWKSIRSDRYRTAWFAGRVCCKLLWLRHQENEGGCPTPALESFSASWAELSIVSRNGQGKGTRPVLYQEGCNISSCLSIAHSETAVLVLLGRSDAIRIGCDLVSRGSATEKLRKMFFDDEESSIRSLSNDAVWAAKEAAYKAVGDGIPFTPKHWRVMEIPHSHSIQCRFTPGGRSAVSLQFSLRDGHVLAVATESIRESSESAADSCFGDRFRNEDDGDSPP